MTNSGVIFKRCGCRHPGSNRLLEAACRRLRERNHGSWYYHCTVTTLSGKRERVRRGGYVSRRDAEKARDALLAQSREVCTTQVWTVARWLRHWLTTRTSIRPSTLRSYTEHVDRHLIPHLGRIRLGELGGRNVTAMFTALAGTDNRYGRPPDPVDTSSDPGHAALGAERRDPRGADPRQPGPVRGTADPAPPAGAGMDHASGRAVATQRPPLPGRGVDRGAGGRLPPLRQYRPAVCDVVVDRPARFASG
jgi:Phage integrase, N-terminal SAM-like domain